MTEWTDLKATFIGIRGIKENLEIDLSSNLTVLTGRNNVGKSRILKTISDISLSEKINPMSLPELKWSSFNSGKEFYIEVTKSQKPMITLFTCTSLGFLSVSIFTCLLSFPFFFVIHFCVIFHSSLSLFSMGSTRMAFPSLIQTCLAYFFLGLILYFSSSFFIFFNLRYLKRAKFRPNVPP